MNKRAMRLQCYQRFRWNSRLLASASLGLLLLLLEACGGNTNGTFTSHGVNGGGTPIGISNNTFAGSLLFVKAGDIFVLHGKDDSLAQLTSDGNDFQPSLSPDGKTIVFEVRKPGNDYSDLATTPFMGDSATLLTDDSQHVRSPGIPGDPHNHYQFWAANPIWTADGQQIIFLLDFFKGGDATTPRRANQTCTLQSEGPNATFILDMGIAEIPASDRPVPGGQVNAPPKQLAWPYCFAGGDQDLSLRPGVADTEILFTSFQYPPSNTSVLISQISVLIVPGDGSPERIVQLSPQDPNAVPMEPSWSPDGKYISFIRRENGQDNLYIMPVDATIAGTPNNESYLLEGGGNSVYYTNTSYYTKAQMLASGILGQPVWGSNNTLFFMMFDNGELNLYLAKVKFGAPAATPTTAPGATPAAGGPGVPTITLDGSPVQLTQGGVDGTSRPVWMNT